MMVKANNCATNGNTWFLMKSGGSIEDLIWRTANLQNENWYRKFRKMEHTKSDSSTDSDDANEWIHSI